VTGTNGKTSVVHFAKQIWAALGYHAENMGTLSGAMTTPYPVAIHEKLAALADNGVTHLALEASSHGLDQYRLDGVNIKAAGFTNLSRDHLDYHADMDAYLAAKSRLFNGLLGEGDVAVLNADIPEYERLTTQTKARVLSYGRKGEDLKILSITPTETGQDCEFKINNETHRIDINLVGEFQIYNLLCALGLVLSEGGINAEKAVKTLEKITGVRGRLEFVSGHPRGAGIYIDYAHTPDALENVLNALRPHTSGNLVCLFGCGGDRDTGKRPQMGDIATRLADRVVITDDNPRSEDPAAIRAAIMAAAPDAREIPDRRKAINHCVSSLQSGDVLLVAGKGHEQGQILAGQTLPFDDVSEVRSSINNM
ncbi:MAG: UDP-N-acetylmuramoyl-L-alanyl-D-glutamate--2,6-diaminopimelate ligase, partial [Bdellovibrionales bacterium]